MRRCSAPTAVGDWKNRCSGWAGLRTRPYMTVADLKALSIAANPRLAFKNAERSSGVGAGEPGPLSSGPRGQTLSHE